MSCFMTHFFCLMMASNNKWVGEVSWSQDLFGRMTAVCICAYYTGIYIWEINLCMYSIQHMAHHSCCQLTMLWGMKLWSVTLLRYKWFFILQDQHYKYMWVRSIPSEIPGCLCVVEKCDRPAIPVGCWCCFSGLMLQCYACGEWWERSLVSLCQYLHIGD